MKSSKKGEISRIHFYRLTSKWEENRSYITFNCFFQILKYKYETQICQTKIFQTQILIFILVSCFRYDRGAPNWPLSKGPRRTPQRAPKRNLERNSQCTWRTPQKVHLSEWIPMGPNMPFKGPQCKISLVCKELRICWLVIMKVKICAGLKSNERVWIWICLSQLHSLPYLIFVTYFTY